jgi:hypothetical protein
MSLERRPETMKGWEYRRRVFLFVQLKPASGTPNNFPRRTDETSDDLETGDR